MTLLTASRTAPSVSRSLSTLSTTSHHSHHRADVLTTTLFPVVHTHAASAQRFQQLLGAAAFHLFVRTYFAASLVATASLWAGRNLAWRALVNGTILAAKALGLAKRLAWQAWDCKRCRRVRKRLEFELFVLILGPGGNAVLLMLFWPGWIMLALAGWGVWCLTG